ncbi:MAG: leucyl aminopeptidase [Deltaproteobacteria bacterium]|nr:leucyl aminopeptidase [Deltaproteobacteria bacterium]
MELRFVPPKLGELDGLDAEVLACSLWEDVRPCVGLAGLCDWRLGGRVSRRLRDGFFAGAAGEVLLLPGRPRLSFDRILLFGAGASGGFDEGRFRQVVEHMLAVIAGLCASVAVVELPGRQSDTIAPERAADMLLEAAARRAEPGIWTLVESAPARRRITEHMIEQRRRVRRSL